MTDAAADLRGRADNERRMAEATTLSNVRDLHTRAAFRWDQLADRAEIVERTRRDRDIAKAERAC